MCRKRVPLNWLLFIGFIYILGTANCYVTDEYDEDNAIVNGNYLKYQDDEDQDEKFPQFDKIIINKREPAFTPYISIGALSNMQQFFENLKENFHSLESLPMDERKALLGRHEKSAGECDHYRRKQSTSAFSHPRTRKHSNQQDTRIFRPPATAAYLHAIRNQKPSSKIRNFVANAEPKYLRGSNHYNPSYLWTGLGRRR